MVVSPSTQIPNGETLNGDGENINGSSARGGGTGGAPTSADRGYEARQRELDQLLEGMLCNVQDIPDLKSQFCPSVDIDSIPSELNRVCPPSAGDRYDGKPVHENGSVMNGGAVGGFHTPSRHHSMRDEFLRSRVPQQRPRAKPAPPTVDPEWASLLMREFEPASRRHNERTRAHSETRNPYIPEVSFDDFNFSDFDSPPISHGSARRNNPLNNYNAWDRRPSASSSTTTSRQTSRKDSLESSQDRSVAEFLNRHPSQHEGKLAGPDRGNNRQDVIDCRDLDELSEEFAAELSSLHHQSQPQPVHQQQQQRYVLETSSERKTYGPVDMWEPTPSQSMTWLQKQQQKLRERREARYRSERSPQEIKLISELKGVQSRMKVVGDHMKPSSSTVATIYDDPPSPSALTSRASPAKQVTQPLNIRVNFNEGSRASPAKTVQNIQHELDDALKSTQQNFGLQRNGSQTSYDRQRSQDSSRSLEEDLEQVILQAQQEIAARNVRAESVERTSTPNFPVCPGTPYLNQNDPRRQQELSNGNLKNPSSYSPSSSSGFSAATGGPLSSNDSGFGGTPVLSEKLPPKSPPSSRRIKWGLQLVRSDSGKKKKAGSGYGSDSTSTTPGLLAEANETPPAGTSAPPPPPPLPPPPPVTPPGDANDTLRNLLRPAYLRSLSSEDDEDAVAKLNESRDSSLDTSKGSSEMGQPNGHVNSICATNTGPATSSASSRTDGSGMSSFQQQRIRPEDIEPPGPGNPVTFVNDLSSFWYKQTISREDAIQVLRDQEPGTFLVRDSTSFPGAFGLALKVGPSTGGTLGKKDTSSESVRHFLIESTTSGVRIKGCQNEPVFGSLSALVYQHSVTPLALPCKLVLPDCDLTENKHLESVEASALATQKLLHQGAACNVIYLHSIDVESLTGPQAVRKTVYAYLSRCDSGVLHPPLSIHFKVSTQGITITDNERLVFFRRHYPIEAVSFCGVDPEERKWKPDAKDTKFGMLTQRQYFGFVARKPGTLADNQCHIFVQLEPEQPATAIINFVNKVMQAYASDQTNRRFV